MNRRSHDASRAARVLDAARDRDAGERRGHGPQPRRKTMEFDRIGVVFGDATYFPQ
ncbi:MAG: hypothetical protein KDK70_20940 [Myxococcales bacterium]|nr:hypothetical protein [Myxococcales bacterium]